ncbi:chloride channel protein [Acidiferrimicrobium sp. IK]|uniref:chloride channel protein n=1 Tax=Acidiferrimicrobium sp. IK TaxID=2871700 RepID=UPI0021CB6594|nr:chloride channel protein [Acidiferrimicrobium sp. IK]
MPAPLVPRRLPSGRGATEQPNNTDEGDATLTPRFWLALAITGVATGLAGDLMMVVLFGLEHLVFGTGPGDFQNHVERASGLHRVASLAAAGAFAGPAWYLLRKWTKGEHSEVDEVIWTGDGRLSPRRSLLTGLISEVVIGMGASIGREAAPKLMGGVSGSVASGWLGLNTAQRRLLVACGAGAGLAAVYNVPLGGALFTAELLVGSVTLPVVLPAVGCAWIATAVAWLYLPQHATYLDIPSYHFTTSLFVWALLAAPIIGLLASGYIRLIGWVSHHRLSGRAAIAGPLLAFSVLGVIGIAYPGLFGNGKDMAHRAFLGQGSLLALFALFALKPLVTALCIGGGASGGLFTPFMSTGAVFGAFTGIAWSMLWPGAPVGAFAIVGGASMLGASIQAPLAGLVLVLELTHSGFQLMVPIMAATFIATAVARHVDGYSIYSARLPAHR